MKKHWPLYRVILVSLASYWAVVAIHHDSLSLDFYRHAGFWVTFALGWCAYYLNFEYVWHRFAMHYRFTFAKPEFLAKFFEKARRDHISEHHRRHTGKAFRSLDPEDMKYRISQLYLFPGIFFVHYAILRPFLGSGPLTGFLAGITWGYILFETVHWFTHTPSVLDEVAGAMADITVLRWVLCPLWWPWLYMQRHHREHHENPDRDYNFTLPFVGDLLGGTFCPAPKDFKKYED